MCICEGKCECCECKCIYVRACVCEDVYVSVYVCESMCECEHMCISDKRVSVGAVYVCECVYVHVSKLVISVCMRMCVWLCGHVYM